MADDSLCELGAVELRRLIGSRTISPTELLEACIERIDALNPAVNAIVSMDREAAREQARAAERSVLRGDELGLLHGLPLGIKDLADTAGLRTTYGSPLFADHVPKQDELVVAALRAAGAVVLAKTNTPEFGAGANTRNPVFGATGNPFDPGLTCGGSSGGSAVALACDMLPLVTGSDNGGSLRIPAGYCGVVGFRPSPGLVPSDKRPLGFSPLPVEGPMGRSVADVCLLLAAQAGFDARDPFSTPGDGRSLRSPEPLDLGSLRVAWSTDLGFARVAQEVRETFTARMQRVAGRFRAAEAATPDLGDMHRTYGVLRAEGFLDRLLALYEGDPERLGALIRANIEEALGLSLADHARAHAAQTVACRKAAAFFRDFDLLLTPVAPVPPFPWREPYVAKIDGEPLASYYQWLALTYGISAIGHPACAIPCGVDPHGLPFGIQVVGPAKADRLTLAAAHALEQLFASDPTLARPRPDLILLRTMRTDFSV